MEFALLAAWWKDGRAGQGRADRQGHPASYGTGIPLGPPFNVLKYPTAWHIALIIAVCIFNARIWFDFFYIYLFAFLAHNLQFIEAALFQKIQKI